MHVVTVMFELVEERADAFRAAVLDNAARSLREEEGCHRFDVCLSDDGLRCFLYELYSTPAAFRLHLESAHFLEFDARAREMVRSKRVETFTLAGPDA